MSKTKRIKMTVVLKGIEEPFVYDVTDYYDDTKREKLLLCFEDSIISDKVGYISFGENKNKVVIRMEDISILSFAEVESVD